MLALSGCALPSALIEANAGNPTGYWEPAQALALNEAFLAKHGSAWGDPRLALAGSLSPHDPANQEFIAALTEFLAGSITGPILVIKEPRITELADLWFEAANRAKLRTSVIIAIRKPNEFIRSVSSFAGAVGHGMSPEWMSVVWLKYALLAERSSRGVRRVVVDYANVMTDWRRELLRIESELQLTLQSVNEPDISGFVDDSLYKHRDHDPLVDPFATRWISRTYRVLEQAAKGQPLDQRELDRVFEEYMSSERAFRLASGDFRTRMFQNGGSP